MNSQDAPQESEPVTTTTAVPIPSKPTSFEFRCCRCSNVIFTSEELVPHDSSKNARGNKDFHNYKHVSKSKNGKKNSSGGATKNVGRGERVQTLRSADVYKMEDDDIDDEYDAESRCTSYFLDPDRSPWVAAESRELHAEALNEAKRKQRDGESCGNGEPYFMSHSLGGAEGTISYSVVDPDTIYCPFCAVKIGAQGWTGSQCSCGTWVTPAFQIHGKAVDKIPRFNA